MHRWPSPGKAGRFKQLSKSSVYLSFPFNEISLAFPLLFISLSAGHLLALMVMWLAGLWPTRRPLSKRSLLTWVHLFPECVYSHKGIVNSWIPIEWDIYDTLQPPPPHKSWFRETRQMCFLPQMLRGLNCSAYVMTFYGSLQMSLLIFKKVPKSNIGSYWKHFSNLTGYSSWLKILYQRMYDKPTSLSHFMIITDFFVFIFKSVTADE